MDQPATPTDINVGETERWLSTIGGGLLACYGLTRGTLSGLGLAAFGGGLLYRGMSGHCQLYSALGISTQCSLAADSVIPAGRGIKVEETIAINKSPGEVYRFWRNLENLPRFMSHLRQVRDLGNGRSHWVALAPLGFHISWDAEIINDQQDDMIAWRSVRHSDVTSTGSVHFRPTADGRETEVKISLKYDPPAGKIGAVIAKLFGEEPSQQIRADLRRLKQVLETGEIATSGAEHVRRF